MGVVVDGTLKTLSESDINNFENTIVEYERLVRKMIIAEKKAQRITQDAQREVQKEHTLKTKELHEKKKVIEKEEKEQATQTKQAIKNQKKEIQQFDKKATASQKTQEKQERQYEKYNEKQIAQYIKQQKIIEIEVARLSKEQEKEEIISNKRGGIFSTDEALDGSLPSSYIKKQRNKTSSRSEEAKEKLLDEKIKPESGLTGGKGAPIQNNLVFKNLLKKVNRLEESQEKLTTAFQKGSGIFGKLQGLTTNPVGSIFSGVLSAARHLPFVGVAVTVSTFLINDYLARYGPGGIHDKRKKILARDTSVAGVDNDNIIASGEIVFFSNPVRLQGLPAGNSNVDHLRDGISRYKQRHEGSYA